MCLISISPKGTDKYSEKLLEALRIAATTNTDGMGYAFKKHSTKNVYISKGYTTVDALIRAIKSHKLKPNDELIIHQRIGNKGAKNEDMCHPFVVSATQADILQNDKYVTEPVMVHNGTFHFHSKHSSEFSDTYFFIKEFISRPELLLLMKNDYDFFKELFSTRLSTNRLCFLFPKEDRALIKFGEYKEDEGYFFSNDSYKDKNLRNVGGVESIKDRTPLAASDRDDSKYSQRQIGFGFFGEDLDDDDDWGDNYYNNKKESASLNSYAKAAVANTVPTTKVYKEAKAENGNIVLTNGTAFDCSTTGVTFRSYMDMFIPNKFIETQYLGIRWNPTILNFSELRMKAIETDTDLGIMKDCFYKIIQFDNTLNGQEGLHLVTRSYSNFSTINRSNPVMIPGYQIPKLFEITTDSLYYSKYKEYYKLCADLSPSKTLLKKIEKFMSTNFKPIDGFVNFRGKKVHAAGLSMYRMMLTKHLFPKEYITMLNKRNVELVER